MRRQVAGTTGNVRLDGDDDEEGASTEEQGAAILAAFGYARRNEVAPQTLFPAPGQAGCFRLRLAGFFSSSRSC